MTSVMKERPYSYVVSRSVEELTTGERGFNLNNTLKDAVKAVAIAKSLLKR